jgi:NitT/TauT family transport system substrate-binding protein
MKKLLIIFMAAFSLLACQNKSKERIKVGYLKITAHAPVVAANNYKVFEKHGLEVELEVYPNTPSLVTALNDGRIDICFQVTPESLWQFQNLKYYAYFLAKSSFENPIDGLYALNPNILDSIKGKTIGHFPGPTPKQLTKKIIKEISGLDENEYEIKDVPPPLQLSSLERSEIDLLFTYEPMGALAKYRVNAVNVSPAPVENYIINPWMGGIGVFSEKFVEERKLDALKFQKAIEEANNILFNREDKKTETLVSLQAGLPPEVAKEVPLTELVFSSKETKDGLFLQLKKQLVLYKELGLTKNTKSNILFLEK